MDGKREREEGDAMPNAIWIALSRGYSVAAVPVVRCALRCVAPILLREMRCAVLRGVCVF